MKRRNGIKKIVIGLLVIGGFSAAIIFKNNLELNKYNHKYKAEIVKYDNFYEGDNIKFYYLDGKNDYQQKLKNKYRYDKLVANGANEIDKTFEMIKWINGKAEFNINAIEVGKNTEEIMKKVETNKVLSDDNYATLLEEGLSTININVRKGKLFASNNTKAKPRQNYKVIEVWSKVHGKWVMIDGGNGCYMTDKDMPLSAVEIIEKGIENVNIVGLENEKAIKKYKKNMSKYFNSYTIEIDNNKFDEIKSNSYVTYVKNKEDAQLENKEGYIGPTIFVNKKDVFHINPEIVYHDEKNDNLPTIILSKRDTKEDTEEFIGFTAGVFKNSVMLEKYYISIDGGNFVEVSTYYDLAIMNGENSIRISEDGKTPIREIAIRKNTASSKK